MTIRVEIPMPIPSASNLSEHWATKARRVKKQRGAVWMVLHSKHEAVGRLPCTVVLTRVAPRSLDGDNLQGALKGVRDGVADWLRVDDATDEVHWFYQQERGKPKYQAVRVEVEAR